ncbi:uncharacterized protein BYT42DRAFT_566194 [Radiomyces spectabilis]|uniref:uncharacterized protein n=1 Tax=Radiomyces spectabilis TaxID=64574 RepID=UPI00221E7E2A|nr:uncharacterized protein BYT42DRAFT_566194 [Radiomyces spectabilis]KAI8381344.1 hypothetical protein BYT42DRAFT_566194 [Radiomyces spectabilis]
MCLTMNPLVFALTMSVSARDQFTHAPLTLQSRPMAISSIMSPSASASTGSAIRDRYIPSPGSVSSAFSATSVTQTSTSPQYSPYESSSTDSSGPNSPDRQLSTSLRHSSKTAQNYGRRPSYDVVSSDHSSNSPPSQSLLSLQERRQRNKTASAKYRAKKNQQHGEMRSMIATLTKENELLVRQLDHARLENSRLKAVTDKLRGKMMAEKMLKRLLSKESGKLSTTAPVGSDDPPVKSCFVHYHAQKAVETLRGMSDEEEDDEDEDEKAHKDELNSEQDEDME